MPLHEKMCCIPNCGKTRADDTILHSFPNPNKENARFLAWRHAVGPSLSSLNDQYIYKYRKVCHSHFDEKYLTWTRRLSANAVPTKLIPVQCALSDHNYNKKQDSEDEGVTGTTSVIKRGSKDTLHKFPHPTKDRELFNTWIYSVGGHILGLENDHIYKYRRVCHIHFEEQYWCQNNRLSNIAVPTKHLPSGSDCNILHVFPHPTRARERYLLWKHIIGPSLYSLDDAYIYKYRKVCHYHFDEKYFTSSKRLAANSVPTKLIPGKIDHTYYKDESLLHVDHNYCKTVDSLESTSGVKKVLPSASGSEAVIDCEPPTDSQIVEGFDHLIVKEVGEFSHNTLADGIVDENDVDDSPPSPVPEMEMETASVEPLFSWEKSELIPADEPEDPGILEEVPEDPSAVSLYDDDVTSQDKPAEQVSLPSEPVITAPREAGYKCKECGETITGFQFWCVQCLGCALCGVCEARGAHHAHYVLRAPAHRPHRQTQVVLAVIRHQLQNENMLTPQDTGDGVVKLEVKEEPIEQEVTLISGAPLDSDPLAAPDHDASFSDDDAVSQVSQESQESRLEEDDDLEEIIEPQPKKPRLAEITKPQPKKTRLADFIEQDFIPPEKPKGSPLPVKVTGAPPPQILIDLDEFEEVEYLDTEVLEIETSTKELDVETNSNVMILGDADMNIVVQRVVADNEHDDTYQILGNVGNDWIVQRGVILDTEETENRLPARGPQELMARSLTTKAVVKLQPLSSVEIRKWTDSKRRRLK